MGHDAVKWMVEHSQAKGAAFAVIKALTKYADQCVATVTVEKIIRATRYSPRNVFRAIGELEELKEVQRLHSVKDRRRRLYHLEKICAMQNGDSRQRVCPQLVDLSIGYKIPDRPKKAMAQISLFSGPMPNWEPVITDEELRWRSEELKRQLGLPVRPKEEFALRAPR
jgi:hypothetical protein